MPTIHHVSRPGQLPRGSRLALYGAGRAGRALRAFLAEERPDLRVVLFVDGRATGPADGVEVSGPDRLHARSDDFDVLLVASGFLLQIQEELARQRIPEYWVCDRHLLDYAAYCMSERCGVEREVTRERSFADPESHVRLLRGQPINFLPSAADLQGEAGIERFVLAGYLPEKPFISKRTRVTAFGSCFAGHIRQHLVAQGYRLAGEAFEAGQAGSRGDAYRYYDKAYVFYRHSDFDNTFVAREQFEWALEGRCFSEQLWYDHRRELCSRDEQAREATRRLFLETDVFIFTLGLAEIWQDIASGEVIWGSIPDEHFDPLRHRFRLSTVAENLENLERIYALIRRHRPEARIVMTLSPVPLNGTWRDIPCLSANTVSKAVLRVAIDELWRRHRDEGFLYYWPSYEIVREATPAPYKADNRHIRDEVVAAMMERFAGFFLTGDARSAPQRVARRPLLAAPPGGA